MTLDSVTKLQLDASFKLLDFRAIARLISLETFERAWDLADATEREIFVGFYKETKRTACFRWVDKILTKKTELDVLTVRHLRLLARQKGIANYHHLNRAQLISELEDVPESKGSVP